MVRLKKGRSLAYKKGGQTHIYDLLTKSNASVQQ